jgi:OmpA-OmpF porin, OOP family
MRKFVAALLVLLTLNATAQKGTQIKRPAFGVSFFMNDFATANQIRTTSLSQTISKDKFGIVKFMNPGLSLNYMQGLTNKIDAKLTAGAYFADYPIEGTALKGSENVVLDMAATVHIKLVGDEYWVSPYLNAGVGATKYLKNYAAYMPLGAGLQVNLYDETFIMLGMNYNVPITSEASYHFNYSLGIFANLGEKEKVAEPVAVIAPPVDKDTDGDGTMDSKDKCITVPGSAKYDGCPIPDTDGDGVNNDEDKCPEVAGLRKYDGCPIPDSDKDGLNDEDDKCPQQAGVARYLGCPVPDGDSDGVNDEDDKCPTEAGPAANNGCPEIKKEEIEKITYAAKNVFFATGSAKLLKKSFAPLNEVVTIMNANPKIALDIEGHTDASGSEPKNVKLSDARAKAVMAYLKKKKIDAARMSAKGFGSSVPVGDNKTKEGKQQNRRVELKPRVM